MGFLPIGENPLGAFLEFWAVVIGWGVWTAAPTRLSTATKGFLTGGAADTMALKGRLVGAADWLGAAGI